MMQSPRVQVKVFANPKTTVDAEAFIPVFHRWIRDDVLDELVIDVADYTHVHHGPGVLLIGHGGDYAYDLADGRPGLVYSRKRAHDGPFAARLEDALRRALGACARIEGDPNLEGQVRFDARHFSVRIPDRLHAPATPATWAEVRPTLEASLNRLLAGATHRATPLLEGRRAFRVDVETDGDRDVGTLLSRLH